MQEDEHYPCDWLHAGPSPGSRVAAWPVRYVHRPHLRACKQNCLIGLELHLHIYALSIPYRQPNNSQGLVNACENLD
jgi:hypothetical protein